MSETVLITGASAGLGRDLAHLFAADGSDLILLARREEALRSLSEALVEEFGVTCNVLPMDLADADAPARIERTAQERGWEIDILVNNAGFGAVGTVAELPLERQMDMVQVNITALTELTRRFLPGMLERGRGGVLNVASTAAFQPGPLMAVYYASKAYVLSFTEAVAEEVRGRGVTVSCLAPGPTATEFGAVATNDASVLFRMGVMQSMPVALSGYRGFRAGKVLVIPGLQNRLASTSVRFSPRSVVRKAVKKLNSPA